jgi:hypothetical protein
MTLHKYTVGQTVTFSPSGSPRSFADNIFKIVRLLPAEGNDNQYRVKNTTDGHERVVKESQLSGSPGGATPTITAAE